MDLLFIFGQIGLAWTAWDRAELEEPREQSRRFYAWLIKGYGAPALAWLLMIVGWFPGIPPLIRCALPSWTGGLASLFDFLAVAGPGLSVVGSFWLALTLGTLAVRLLPRMRDRRERWVIGGLCALLSAPFAYLAVHWLGGAGGGLAVCLAIGPVVYVLVHYPPLRPPQPFYAQAVAMMKRGKYADAEWAVIAELEKCGDDFAGWMMLAELYATRFHDMPSAVQTVSDLCSQPNLTPTQVAMALHRLADWQLQYAEDPNAARVVLDQIRRRFPDTHLAHMAGVRIQQLPANRTALLEAREVKKVHLPDAEATFEQAVDPPLVPLSREAAVSLAQEHSARLTRDPNDILTREAFARVLAERLGQAPLAVEQLDLLLNLPSAPHERKAGWLLLQAAWQFKYLQDRPAAQRLLARLLADHPKSRQAFSAQRTLTRMEVEDRYRRAGRIVLPTPMGPPDAAGMAPQGLLKR